MRFTQFLHQPVRIFNNNNKKWTFIISSILFAAMFILVYQPFGISIEMEKPTTTWHRIASFVGTEVIAIFISLYIFQFIVLKRYNHTTMRLQKYLNIFLLQMLCISIIQHVLDSITEYFFFPYEIDNDHDLDDWIDDSTPIGFILDAMSSIAPQIFVLSYPFMGCLLYFHIRDLKEEVYELETELFQFKNTYKTHDNNEVELELLDENNQIEYRISLNRLLALESSNQYVLIYYIENNTISKHIIRTRLKKIINELSDTPVIQCHRSYAVNLLNVEQLKSIDKKSFLTLTDSCQLKIPVSKTFLPQIKSRLLEGH